ncbi:nicotinamide riboside transporter PnuC [Flavobacterium cheonhonense]|uniref:Nicotinamide riboside transporter PnuC n=1 Tax=Flavobacterium cheonhonense TaxID=706185 RepID=A0ABP7U3W9_9FLAO|nr:nicotinamide riboside transporter PnuC [Flavobacterium cheonhonense]PJE39681.1 MAG: nicotinamide mononucleotide transporter [Flavobacterium sp.] [Flavobacterium sp. FEMGT703F]
MLDFFISQYQNASFLQIILEFLVFVFGIASVVLAKKENIWVYPTGLIATVITTYLLYQAKYFGDMTMNAYYSLMSLYGWYKWSAKTNEPEIKITRTNMREKLIGLGLFGLTMVITYMVYKFFDYKLEIPNYIDIFTSGLFFTAMWYMALKKIENWTLWIIGDCIVVPLFAYRGLGMLSLQYFIFTILAVYGYLEWKKIILEKKV